MVPITWIYINIECWAYTSCQSVKGQVPFSPPSSKTLKALVYVPQVQGYNRWTPIQYVLRFTRVNGIFRKLTMIFPMILASHHLPMPIVSERGPSRVED